MSMKSIMVRGAAGLGAILTFTLPAAALAATPQQIIDKGLSDFALTTPSLSSGEVKVNFADRDQNVRDPKSTATMTLVVKERKIPKAGSAIPNTDGTIVVKTVEGTGAYAIPTISNPGTIEFRIVDGIGYVRVKEISDGVSLFLAAKGIDASSAVGAWVKIDPAEICSAVGSACSSVAGASAMGIQMASDIAKMKPIQVTRTERRWTAPNGDKMVRVRARVSPAVVTNLQNKEIAKVPKTEAKRAAHIAAINKQFAEMRKQLANTTMAINLNLTKSTVDRVEAASIQIQKKQTCTLNAAKKQTCKAAGTQTVTTLAGMNIAAGNAAAIVAPESSISAVSTATSLLQVIQGAM
jgi:hypothetical protein